MNDHLATGIGIAGQLAARDAENHHETIGQEENGKWSTEKGFHRVAIYFIKLITRSQLLMMSGW